jgi:DNA-binding Lrp family transcriptional regulator
MSPLIMSVILDANFGPIHNDPQLSRLYACLEDVPPDDLRRPVSINAVAASLRLPYETVRRRVGRLARAGACVITPRGVLVPPRVIDNPAHMAAAIARYERLKAFYFELKALNVLEGIAPRPPEGLTHARPPVRAANRLISEYTLRVMDAIMRRLGDPLTGLILLEMGRANAEHLTPEQQAQEIPMSDAERKPIPTLTLAKRLGLPPETVRRHVRALEERGFCRQVRGGRLAAVEQLVREGGGHGLAENLQNIQRLFTRCATLGVTGFWEDEAAAAGAGKDS